jgi:hypothetical protein
MTYWIRLKETFQNQTRIHEPPRTLAFSSVPHITLICYKFHKILQLFAALLALII